MKIDEVKAACHLFYRRFSALNLRPCQLELFIATDSVSIAIVKLNGDIETVISITCDKVRLLKISSFDPLNTIFTFESPFELYSNLIAQMLLCCLASRIEVSVFHALSATLGKRINDWRELILHICTLTPRGQPKIIVKETRQGALEFLEASFCVIDEVFIFEGPYYKSETKYNDPIELVYAILEALSKVFLIHGHTVDPFAIYKSRN